MKQRRVDLDWMLATELQRIIDIFAAANCEIRFVGGCVRNSILGHSVTEIDIATDALPNRVQEILRSANIKAVPTGIEHGTITAVVGDRSFEITTYRRDVKTDGRWAVVDFGTDWRDDAARRDFTINALSITPDGAFYDPFGGEADLLAGRVRFVGEASHRVREDILRILRWFRFHAYFGNRSPDAEALAACRGFAYRIPDLSGERIQYELLRLLDAPNPISSLQLMAECGVLDAVLGHRTQLNLITGICKVERLTQTPKDALLRLAALLRKSSAVENLANRLKLSKKARQRLSAALAKDPALDPTAATNLRRRVLYHLEKTSALDRIMLAWAADTAGDHWGDWLKTYRTFTRPVFPLTGHDVTWMDTGPAVGEALKSVEAWWIEQDFAPGRTACLTYLNGLRLA